LSSEFLQEFNTEYNNAKNNLSEAIQLPVNNVDVEYNRQYDNLYLKGNDYKIQITDASSGFQSFVPLYLVSHYLANSVKTSSNNKDSMSAEERNRFKDDVQKIWNNIGLTDEQKRLAISALSAKFNKTAFINIVEEPEQNLYPVSQKQMIQSLLEFNNINDGNKLIITTHSPYLINYLTLAIKADFLKKQIKSTALENDLQQICPLKSTVNSKDVAIYELDENKGTMELLNTYDGLPSDENKLNVNLDESNELFAKLLEIQQKL
jgi:hypothetical protein